ncbi:AI-2E family transporter, partial [Streptomyces noursei]
MRVTDETSSRDGSRPADPPPARADDDRYRARMPRWLPRAMVLALALVACFQLATWGFHQLIGLLLNVLIAFFLALAVEPAVASIAARGMRRGLATGLVFLAILVGTIGFFALLGS